MAHTFRHLANSGAPAVGGSFMHHNLSLPVGIYDLYAETAHACLRVIPELSCACYAGSARMCALCTRARLHTLTAVRTSIAACHAAGVHVLGSNGLHRTLQCSQ